MEYGYARVSSTGQNLDRQIEELRKYVDEEYIVCDKASGKNIYRQGYQSLKSSLGLRRGDALYIMSLDRLSRNKEDTMKELQWFKDNGIRLMILDLPTSMIQVPKGQEWIIDMINNILIEVLSSIAEQERLTIRKRQRQGIDAAKAKGKHLGILIFVVDLIPKWYQKTERIVEWYHFGITIVRKGDFHHGYRKKDILR